MKPLPTLLSVLIACAVAIGTAAHAQDGGAPPMAPVPLRSAADLDQMLGPIALYPDPLIAQILAASTLPAEIVQADRYIMSGGTPDQIDQQPWDSSVKALAHYPTVLKWMDDSLPWTTALGQAFASQQQDVMDAVQRLRARAQALGNLQSNPEESVVSDGSDIEVLPTNPEVIYVPYYVPDQVYYMNAYGAPFVTFGAGFAVGGWLDFDFDWHSHGFYRWDHDHPRPPNWWHLPPGSRPHPPGLPVWQPHSRPFLPAKPLDRGWQAIGEHGVPAQREREVRPAVPAREAPVVRPRPEPVRPAPARPASGAFIGIQSAHETQHYSNRGQESRGSSPAPSHAGGGGGGHSSGGGSRK